MTNPAKPGKQVEIRVPEEQQAGVWANMARVTHSPYEFTIDFARVDFSAKPSNGVITARVNMSPLFVTQLIEALQANWQQYAAKAMPPELDEDL